MVVPAARRRPSMAGMFGYDMQQQQPRPGVSQQLMDIFSSTLGGLMSPSEMYAAESAPLESSFAEAGEKMRSRLAASGGGGNVRAIQAGEERLAKTKGEALGRLRSDVNMRALSQQLTGAQLLKILQGFGAMGASPVGGATFGR